MDAITQPTITATIYELPFDKVSPCDSEPIPPRDNHEGREM